MAKQYRKAKNGRRKAKRQPRTTKRAAKPAKFDTTALRQHVRLLCRDWRLAERALDHAFEKDDHKAVRVHERNMGLIEREMRRIWQTVDIFPVWVDY